MYYDLRNEYVEFKGRRVAATIVKNFLVDANKSSAWSYIKDGKLHDWPDKSMVVKFEVDGDAPHPDAYWSASSGFLKLYSPRLVSFLNGQGISFETYDTVTIDKKTKKELELDYKILRLLEVHQVIDVSKSDVRGEPANNYRFRHLVVKDEYLQSPKLMFRDPKFQILTIVHESLKNRLEQGKFTGLSFKPLYEIYSGSWKPSEIHGDTDVVQTPDNATPKQPQTSVDERLLSEEAFASLSKDVNDGWQYLDNLSDTTTTDVVKAIKVTVRKMRQESLSKEQLQVAALCLGSLWGEQVCKAYSWHWATIKSEDADLRAVISPDGAYYVLPLNFVWRHFTEPNLDETIALLFNMLADPEKSGLRRIPKGYLQLS